MCALCVIEKLNNYLQVKIHTISGLEGTPEAEFVSFSNISLAPDNFHL